MLGNGRTYATLGVPYYRVSRIFHPCNMVPHFHASHFQHPLDYINYSGAVNDGTN